ncbi:MAG: hypothetical protein F6K00_19620 [Leptolyngbya sp. SIOISBB]|nr:hypothetical protein [Leptolyngbya sp. SIOISBB]
MDQKVSINVQPQVTRLSVGHGYPPQGNGGIGPETTDDLLEGGTNLYYTQNRFDAAFAAKTPSDLGAQAADDTLDALTGLTGAGFVVAIGTDSYQQRALVADDIPDLSSTYALASSIPDSPEAVGLGNADNTADVDKPVSTAQQQALDGKVGFIAGALTEHAGTQVNTAAGNFTTAVNLSGAHVLRGGICMGTTMGIRITIDGGTPLTYDALSSGDDAAGNLFDIKFIPSGYACTTSMLIEIQNQSGQARDIGWHIYTEAI